MRSVIAIVPLVVLVPACDQLCPPYGNNPNCEFHDPGDTDGSGDLPTFPEGLHPCQIAADTWSQEVGPVHWVSRPWSDASAPSADLYQIPEEPHPVAEAVFDAFAQAWNLPYAGGFDEAPAWLGDPSDIYVTGRDRLIPAERIVAWAVVDPNDGGQWEVYRNTFDSPLGPGGERWLLHPVAQVGDASVVAASMTGPGSVVFPHVQSLIHSWHIKPRGGTLGRIAGWQVNGGDFVHAIPAGAPGANIQPVTEAGYGWIPQGGMCYLTPYPEGTLDGGDAPLVPSDAPCNQARISHGCKTVQAINPWGSYQTCSCS